MDLKSLKIERGAKPVPRRQGSPWPLRIGTIAVLAAAGWLFWPLLSDFSDRVRLPAVRTFLVVEAAPATAAAVRGTAANGYVVAARRAALSSDVPGRIVEMAVQEGSVVKKGDIVARLYADEYRAALMRATAELSAATANVTKAGAAVQSGQAEVAEAVSAVATEQARREQATAQLHFAQTEFHRIDELVRTGVGSARDLEVVANNLDTATANHKATDAIVTHRERTADTTRQRLLVAESELVVAKAQLEAAAAARDLAQATLDKTDVRAPFDGIVVLKDAEVGEVVSPNSMGGSNARGAVCTMVDFDSLEVQANVPETTIASVRLGARADVFLDAFPDDRYEGVVDRIWPTADRQKATIEVRVRLSRPDQRLRPEMGVRVVFRTEAEDVAEQPDTPAARTILIPENAVVRVEGVDGAFVVERDQVRFAKVTVGERRAGRMAIDAGLSPGQRIVLDPPTTLKHGGRIRLVQP